MNQSLGNENFPVLEAHHGTDHQGNRKREAEGQKYKMLDGAGLSLLVLPTGTKLWLWRYQFNGGEKNMTFGEYPLVGPKDARELHFAAKKLLATGINPMAERKAEAEAKQQEAKALEREADSSFENVAGQWWA